LYLIDFQKHSFSELKYTINNVDINVILYLLAEEQTNIEDNLVKQGIKDGLNGAA
jgi:NADH/NAD ratio-sensing transcriptional regulator Rex